MNDKGLRPLSPFNFKEAIDMTECPSYYGPKEEANYDAFMDKLAQVSEHHQEFLGVIAKSPDFDVLRAVPALKAWAEAEEELSQIDEDSRLRDRETDGVFLVAEMTADEWLDVFSNLYAYTEADRDVFFTIASDELNANALK